MIFAVLITNFLKHYLRCFVVTTHPMIGGKKERVKKMKKNLKLFLCVFGLLFAFAAEASAQNNTDGTPCEDLCVMIAPGDGEFSFQWNYQRSQLGTYVACNWTYDNIKGGSVFNYSSTRKIYINGRLVKTGNGNFSYIPAKRNGGYCIYTGMGEYWNAGWNVWNW